MDHLRKALLFGLLTVLPVAGAAAAPILELIPANGAIAGPPGSVVGWGLTLTNTTDFVVVTGSDFVTSSTLGTFTDFIGPNFIVVGPAPESPSVSQPFNLGLLTGIGSFAISPSATAGTMATGEILLTYDLFSRSPNDVNFNPITDTISVGNVLSQRASVTAIPEPASWLMMGAGGVVFAVWRRRR